MKKINSLLGHVVLLGSLAFALPVCSQSYQLDFDPVQVASDDVATVTWTYPNPFTGITIQYVINSPTGNFSPAEGIQPDNVSFGHIQIEEIGQNATGMTGYFTNHPPSGHTTAAGA